MKTTDALMLVAVVAVALSTVNLIITVNKIGDFKILSGFVTDTGVANLTIQSNVNVNFTTANITWGTGYVNSTLPSAELTTQGIMNGTGWNNVTSGLILENIGNENVNLTLYASKAALAFLGSATAVFEWNTTEAEAGSCPTLLNITDWTTVTTAMQPACDNFTFDTTDTIEIDLRVVIPEDASVGDKGVTITANAETLP
ncbi:MAG: hypothetical protein PVJ67_04570 [Candidatus Pacearchaeota archaeon]|jgi:hypothetical protein